MGYKRQKQDNKKKNNYPKKKKHGNLKPYKKDKYKKV